MPDDGSPGSNAAQLKDDINRGRTGGKVSLFDPAAAPLGTDDEAAGTPPSGSDVDHARRQEVRRPEQPPSIQDQPLPMYWSLAIWVASATLVALAAFILMQ